MKIDSTFSSGMNVISLGDKEELAVRMKDSRGTDTEFEKPLNTSSTDKNSDSVIGEDMIHNAINQANKTLEEHGKYVERRIHEVTHTVMYVIKDKVTNEVIREFPPEKIEDMIAKMWELAGLFVDERR